MPLPLYRIEIVPGGWVFEADGTTPLLKAAEAAGVLLPSSCRNGTCRTCISRVESGQARHLIAWPGLSAEEKSDGDILPCCAVAETDLVLRSPAARKPGA